MLRPGPAWGGEHITEPSRSPRPCTEGGGMDKGGLRQEGQEKWPSPGEGAGRQVSWTRGGICLAGLASPAARHGLVTSRSTH